MRMHELRFTATITKDSAWSQKEVADAKRVVKDLMKTFKYRSPSIFVLGSTKLRFRDEEQNVLTFDTGRFLGMVTESVRISMTARGSSLLLVVEIKGYRREDAKDKKATMETYWVPGVNHLGTYGRWAFAEFTEVYQIEPDFEAKVEGKFNEMIELTAFSMIRLLQGRISVKSIGGPLTIFEVAGTAAEEGALNYIALMAFISINLGLINLLPIPVLDGGHLMFFAVEAVARKPLSMRIREYAYIAGLVILLVIMALAFKNDIERLWPDIVNLIAGD